MSSAPAAATTTAATTTTTNTLGDKWFKPFYQGSMKSNTNETWSYDRGVVKCTFGIHGNKGEFQWNGSELKNNSGKETQTVVFDGTALHAIFPGDNAAFYSSLLTETDDGFKWKMSQVKWSGGTDWTHDKKSRTLKVDEGTGKGNPEGCTTEWTVLGEVPPPVALAIAQFGRAEAVREAMIERLNRTYWRCKILTVAPVDAYLCPQCAKTQGTCICCSKEAKGHSATQCKQCSVKGKFLCVRCNDPVGPTRVKGSLCDDCGLGSRAKECCKMRYKELR